MWRRHHKDILRNTTNYATSSQLTSVAWSRTLRKSGQVTPRELVDAKQCKPQHNTTETNHPDNSQMVWYWYLSFSSEVQATNRKLNPGSITRYVYKPGSPNFPGHDFVIYHLGFWVPAWQDLILSYVPCRLILFTEGIFWIATVIISKWSVIIGQRSFRSEICSSVWAIFQHAT